ncbi:MAG: NAD(P)H-dependent oxidoreductase, partial [Clostridia bacterium]|nr:NAD(P)H-dependent oxidoreductase [Clostridia bacterium]
MDILVINGSPKGKYSITLQHVNYLQRKYKEHTFKILHAGQTIKALEKNFEVAVASIRAADAIIFSYPVYTFLAPSQLHRFIELMKESRVYLSDNLVTKISYSK